MVVFPAAVIEPPQRVSGSVRLAALAFSGEIVLPVLREKIRGELHLLPQLIGINRNAARLRRNQRHDGHALIMTSEAALALLHRTPRPRREERQ